MITQLRGIALVFTENLTSKCEVRFDIDLQYMYKKASNFLNCMRM